MNMYQGLNNAIFGGTMLALIAGLFRDGTPFAQRPLSLWLFVTFFFLLRLKIFWDDQQYFGKTETKNPNFKIGVMVGLVSWLVWVAAAWAVGDLRESYFLVGVALGISVLWIVAVALRRSGAYKEQYYWIATNTVFILLLWWLYKRNLPVADVVTWCLLGFTIVLVIIDFLLSKSVPELEK